MQIFRSLAGYSLGRADIVRRAMAKKKAKVMEEEKQVFIHGLLAPDGSVEVNGCIRRGVDEKTALEIFGEMESFAAYAFNKSHAAAYAVVAYQTAWLKCHYPREYLASLMTSVLSDNNKLSAYIAECLRLGIRVLPPHVNESRESFTVVGTDIRFGLLAVRNLGRSFIERLVTEREENGKFTTFYSFCRRMFAELNRRALESLIKCGSLDNLDCNRRQMLENADFILSSIEEDKRRNLEGQLGFFGQGTDKIGEEEEFRIPPAEEYSKSDLLAFEKEVTGMFLSGHPMAEYMSAYENLSAVRLGEILDPEKETQYPDGCRVNVIGFVSSYKTKVTKSNATMAFLSLEDMFGSLEVLVFPAILSQYGNYIKESSVVLIKGRVSRREEEDAKLICEQAGPIPTSAEMSAVKAEGRPVNATSTGQHKRRAPGLYLKVPGENSPRYERARQLMAVFDGFDPVYIYMSDSGKMFRAPASMCVSVNEILLRELRRVLGERNVVWIDKMQQ